MTHAHGSNSDEGAGSFPPGVAPTFGDVPLVPFEHTPERLVLSSDEHSRLAGYSSVAGLGGNFSHERFGTGSLLIRETGAPGEIQIHADVTTLDGPAVHLEARVRESWLARAVACEVAVPANVTVVTELFRLAEIPRQSTVTVRVDSD